VLLGVRGRGKELTELSSELSMVAMGVARVEFDRRRLNRLARRGSVAVTARKNCLASMSGFWCEGRVTADQWSRVDWNRRGISHDVEISYK